MKELMSGQMMLMFWLLCETRGKLQDVYFDLPE